MKQTRKDEVIMLRKKGLSYVEIHEKVHVPKSTLSQWLRGVSLTDPQRMRLEERRRRGLRLGAERKRNKTRLAIEAIKFSSTKNIHAITRREFWLMGIMLYWRERMMDHQQHDVRKGVGFSSSDQQIVKFFLKWLLEIGKLNRHEILLDIFVPEEKKDLIESIVSHWSDVTGFARNSFARVYIQKRIQRKYSDAENIKPRTISKSRYGLLRMRVRASSMLARQLAGWIQAIIKISSQRPRQ